MKHKGNSGKDNNSRLTFFYIWGFAISIAVIYLTFYVLVCKSTVAKIIPETPLFGSILTISSLIFGFSLIVLYSIFNTSIQDRRDYLNEKIASIQTSNEAFVKKYISENTETQIDLHFKRILDIEKLIVLTYKGKQIEEEKLLALQHFEDKPFNTLENSYKELIRNYFITLPKSDYSVSFYERLETLVNKWFPANN
jgi:hypothetical protein